MLWGSIAGKTRSDLRHHLLRPRTGDAGLLALEAWHKHHHHLLSIWPVPDRHHRHTEHGLVLSTTLFHWWSRRIRTLHQLNQPSYTFPSQGKHRSSSVISSSIILGLARAHPILPSQPSSPSDRRCQC